MNVLHMCRNYIHLMSVFDYERETPFVKASIIDKVITKENGDKHFFFYREQDGDKWGALEYGMVVLHCPVPLVTLQRINLRIRE